MKKSKNLLLLVIVAFVTLWLLSDRIESAVVNDWNSQDSRLKPIVAYVITGIGLYFTFKKKSS